MSKKNLYPENKEEENFVKETAENLETKSNLLQTEIEELTDWQKESIEKGIDDFANGRISTSEEVRKGARLCLK